jgi:hypothetical protein
MHRWLLVCFAIVLLTGLVAGSRNRIYDERYHLDRMDQVRLGRPWRQIFTERTVSAVGPVFPICAAAVARLSPDVRAVRLLVFACAGAIFALTVFVLRRISGTGDSAVLLFGASPFVVSSMMALTELPALVFVTAAFATIWVSFNRWPRIIISGALLALAVWSRQTSVLFALPLAAAWFVVARIRLVEMLALLAAPAAASLGLLALWGGVVPPGLESLTGGFSVLNVTRGAIYCAVIGCMMNPVFLRGWLPATAIATGLVLNAILGLIHEPVLLTLFPHNPGAAAMFSRIFFGIGIGVCLAYFGNVGSEIWVGRRGLAAVWLGCVFTVVISCGTIASFSSRYIVAAIPFLLLISASRPSPWHGKLSRLLAVIGFIAGLNALRVYGLWTQ